MGRLCPKSTSLGRKQERYVGYAGVEFGSIPASRCVSTAFQRGMTRRDAAPSVIIIVNQPFVTYDLLIRDIELHWQVMLRQKAQRGQYLSAVDHKHISQNIAWSPCLLLKGTSPTEVGSTFDFLVGPQQLLETR